VPDSLHHRVPWRLSDNRVLLELIELGIETGEQKEQAFFELAERFRASDDRPRPSNWETSWGGWRLGSRAKISSLPAASREVKTPVRLTPANTLRGPDRHG
jgi:hypothetical protein